MNEIWEWAKRNPWIAGIAVFGIGLVILWLLGYIGGGSSSQASSGASGEQQTQQNLAAAYYAAEAAQATAGTQLQITQANDTAAENIYGAQDNAAVAINSSQYQAAVNEANIYAGLGTTEANDQMNSSNYVQSETLAAIQANDAAQQAEYSGYYGTQSDLGNAYIDYLNNALPYEFAPTTTTTQTNPDTVVTTQAPANPPTISPSFTNVVNVTQPAAQPQLVSGEIDNAAWGEIPFEYTINQTQAGQEQLTGGYSVY